MVPSRWNAIGSGQWAFQPNMAHHGTSWHMRTGGGGGNGQRGHRGRWRSDEKGCTEVTISKSLYQQVAPSRCTHEHFSISLYYTHSLLLRLLLLCSACTSCFLPSFPPIPRLPSRLDVRDPLVCIAPLPPCLSIPNCIFYSNGTPSSQPTWPL